MADITVKIQADASQVKAELDKVGAALKSAIDIGRSPQKLIDTSSLPVLLQALDATRQLENSRENILLATGADKKELAGIYAELRRNNAETTRGLKEQREALLQVYKELTRLSDAQQKGDRLAEESAAKRLGYATKQLELGKSEIGLNTQRMQGEAAAQRNTARRIAFIEKSIELQKSADFQRAQALKNEIELENALNTARRKGNQEVMANLAKREAKEQRLRQIQQFQFVESLRQRPSAQDFTGFVAGISERRLQGQADVFFSRPGTRSERAESLRFVESLRARPTADDFASVLDRITRSQAEFARRRETLSPVTSDFTRRGAGVMGLSSALGLRDLTSENARMSASAALMLAKQRQRVLQDTNRTLDQEYATSLRTISLLRQGVQFRVRERTELEKTLATQRAINAQTPTMPSRVRQVPGNPPTPPSNNEGGILGSLMGGFRSARGTIGLFTGLLAATGINSFVRDVSEASIELEALN